MRPLRVAFVGMKRPPSDLPPDYWETFVQYHLELPLYYAKHSACEIDVTTVEPVGFERTFVLSGGSIRCITEGQFLDPTFDQESQPYDVVVHWRRWFSQLYVPGARNVILCQDHSFSQQWLGEVQNAFVGQRLEGVLVFPTWHKENTAKELRGIVPEARLYDGMTLGVDTDTYFPSTAKHRFHLLWASDPGRGLQELVTPFLRLWAMDRRYRLTVTYPDYVRPEVVAPFGQFLRHPGVTHMPGLRNGPRLWSLFNEAGVLPYSSTFPEPSSRCHRQAMAAGCLVLYPPNMGTPSRLIEDGVTGIVAPVHEWADVVRNIDPEHMADIQHNARTFALSENWAVQAARFHSFFSKGIE